MAGTVLKLVGLLALFPVGVLWHAYVTTILWSWFIVDTFGLPELRIPEAYGLILVVNLIKYTETPQKENEAEDEAIIRAISKVIGIPLVGLGFGWVVTWFL